MKTILGLGNATMDYLQVIETFPRPNTKSQSKHAELQGGGSAMNALVMLARLGNTCLAYSAVGADPIGEMIVKELNAYEVQTNFIQTISQVPSSLSSILVTASGQRTIIGNYQLEGRLFSGNIDAIPWSTIDLIHLDGHHINAALILGQAAQKKKVLVSLDGGHCTPGIEKLLPYIDILITSAEFPGKLRIQSLSAFKKLAPKAKVIISTEGEKGVKLLMPDATLRSFPAFPCKVTDTTGAGDVFHGAFLHHYLHNGNVEDAILFGQAAACLKLQHLGARKGMPTEQMIRAFLRQKN
ncbi:MAG: hypothetical protein HY817_00605 [Candidatus Abawacabacteria bacterium]|nr:hypothetical protein [Candidatus Abawacabacteria bacterium]